MEVPEEEEEDGGQLMGLGSLNSGGDDGLLLPEAELEDKAGTKGILASRLRLSFSLRIWA